MPRNQCLRCVSKHLGKALVNYLESRLGYPIYWVLVVGNLSEAEDESILEWPQLATKIREERTKYMEDRQNYQPKIMSLIEWADTLLQEWENKPESEDEQAAV